MSSLSFVFRPSRISVTVVLALVLAAVPTLAESWTVVVGNGLEGEEGIRLAAEDLVASGAEFGLDFVREGDGAMPVYGAVDLGPA